MSDHLIYNAPQYPPGSSSAPEAEWLAGYGHLHTAQVAVVLSTSLNRQRSGTPPETSPCREQLGTFFNLSSLAGPLGAPLARVGSRCEADGRCISALARSASSHWRSQLRGDHGVRKIAVNQNGGLPAPVLSCVIRPSLSAAWPWGAIATWTSAPSGFESPSPAFVSGRAGPCRPSSPVACRQSRRRPDTRSHVPARSLHVVAVTHPVAAQLWMVEHEHPEREDLRVSGLDRWMRRRWIGVGVRPRLRSRDLPFHLDRVVGADQLGAVGLICPRRLPAPSRRPFGASSQHRRCGRRPRAERPDRRHDCDTDCNDSPAVLGGGNLVMLIDHASVFLVDVRPHCGAARATERGVCFI